MRVHWLQHVPFEGLGSLEAEWKRRGALVSVTRFWAEEALPEVEEIDLLVVMGGPMNIYQDALHPWLPQERAFLRSYLEQGKPALGICLGAQLLAEALGGKVSRNQEVEIGWFPLRRLPSEGPAAELQDCFPAGLEVLHWHGDTFSWPREAVPLFASEACARQVFLWRGRVLGLQFHLEMRLADGEGLVREAGRELETGGDFVQSACEILAEEGRFQEAHQVLSRVLDWWLPRVFPA
ncbi:MAG: type 1 glutamine amidotransferase [Verrucomicrobiota bacterium]